MRCATAVSPLSRVGRNGAARRAYDRRVRAPPIRFPAAALLAAALLCGAARAQQEGPRPWSLDLTVHDFGIRLGSPRPNDGPGLDLRRTAPLGAHGVDGNIWIPGKEGAKSEVD